MLLLTWATLVRKPLSLAAVIKAVSRCLGMTEGLGFMVLDLKLS